MENDKEIQRLTNKINFHSLLGFNNYQLRAGLVSPPSPYIHGDIITIRKRSVMNTITLSGFSMYPNCMCVREKEKDDIKQM